MEILLKEDYPAYLNTLKEPAHRGLRVNTLKVTTEQLKERIDFDLKPTAISDTVFEIARDLSGLGNSIAHRMGLFYLQEISAASAVEVLKPQPNEWVLDLCAAPGGKTTQIAMKMQNQGILFANEVDSERSLILLSNCERCGIANAVITNSTPSKLKEVYAGWMDRVLVDAPCSGEGMFKKESQALSDWSEEHVKACAQRQSKILEDAIVMLKEGGILVYSTCTYAIEENEGVIHQLLQNHPEMELLDAEVDFGRAGLDFGLVEGAKVRRIFPMDQGEGHFIAKLKKNRVQVAAPINTIQSQKEQLTESFLKEQLNHQEGLKTTLLQDKIYLAPFELFKLQGIRVLRQGILVGELRKGRIEPHQHFYVTAMLNGQYKRIIDCTKEEVDCILRGETIPKAGLKGYYALRYQGISFGFTKVDGTTAKNHYPKGLRIRNRGD